MTPGPRQDTPTHLEPDELESQRRPGRNNEVHTTSTPTPSRNTSLTFAQRPAPLQAGALRRLLGSAPTSPQPDQPPRMGAEAKQTPTARKEGTTATRVFPLPLQLAQSPQRSSNLLPRRSGGAPRLQELHPPRLVYSKLDRPRLSPQKKPASIRGALLSRLTALPSVICHLSSVICAHQNDSRHQRRLLARHASSRQRSPREARGQQRGVGTSPMTSAHPGPWMKRNCRAGLPRGRRATKQPMPTCESTRTLPTTLSTSSLI